MVTSTAKTHFRPLRGFSKKVSGFTLVELLMTLVIAGVLAAIAVPSFQSLVRTQRTKNASFELFSSLIVARSEAIKNNANVTITPTSGSWQAGWQITNNAGTVLKQHGALSSITISGGPTSLVYSRTGRLANTSSPSFQIDASPSDNNAKRCVSIDLSGAPRTAKGTCS